MAPINYSTSIRSPYFLTRLEHGAKRRHDIYSNAFWCPRRWKLRLAQGCQVPLPWGLKSTRDGLSNKVGPGLVTRSEGLAPDPESRMP